MEKIEKILTELTEDNFEIRNFPYQSEGKLAESIRVSYHVSATLLKKKKKIENCASAGSCNIKTSQLPSGGFVGKFRNRPSCKASVKSIKRY